MYTLGDTVDYLLRPANLLSSGVCAALTALFLFPVTRMVIYICIYIYIYTEPQVRFKNSFKKYFLGPRAEDDITSGDYVKVNCGSCLLYYPFTLFIQYDM